MGVKAGNIGWEHFHTLLVFARHGSLRRAGVELTVHPSTVCRRIEALERRLGVNLFRREHHVLRITEAGRSALEPAERIAAQIANLERTLSRVDDKLAGKVRIGVPCELAACMIDAINEFERANPSIDVEIRSISTDTDLDCLDVDCAVAVTDHPPNHLIGRLLGRLTAAAYASAAYLDQHDPAGAPEACAGIRLTSLGKRGCDLMEQLLPDVPVRTRCDDVGCMLHALRAGMGIAALPCMLGDSEPSLARVGAGRIELAGVWLLAHPDTRSVVRIEAARSALATAIARCVCPRGVANS
ncbi:MAG: LysR family transcriptional regulator [Gammaproteobacteria bacterium]|nr:LysR family transcriptional regulator [Gammaproteobacteria bacterium]